MEISDLLVILDNSPSSALRFELALSYAAEFRAMLTAVCLGIPENLSETSVISEQLYRQKCDSAGVANRWSVCSADTLMHYVHASDLILVGQGEAAPLEGKPMSLPERLVLSSGRPVVVVPYAWKMSPTCERVLIAWSDGRESARALHDAMPFLRRASRVHLVNLVTEPEAIEGADERLSEVAGHLFRRNIKHKSEMVLSLDFPPGDMLLNRACEERSDLLVMGACRRSATGREQFGPVARQILGQMTLPVLFSH